MQKGVAQLGEEMLEGATQTDAEQTPGDIYYGLGELSKVRAYLGPPQPVPLRDGGEDACDSPHVVPIDVAGIQ